MLKNKRFLGIITARSGSKRMPGKNTADLCGKPMLQWSTDAAMASRYLDKVIVSTDNDAMSKIAVQSGCDVPFMRPAELAGDTASSIDVVIHAVDFLARAGEVFDFVVLLQPTSPLRTAEHIDEAIELLISKEADSVVSVCEAEHSPLWMNTLPEDKGMGDFISEELMECRSQELPTYYRLNGAIYITNAEILMDSKIFLTKSRSFAYIMPKKVSVDIDERLDFLLAEAILSDNEHALGK